MQGIKVVHITAKNINKNKGALVLKILNIPFLITEGQLTPQSVVESGCGNPNSSVFVNDTFKMKVLKC